MRVMRGCVLPQAADLVVPDRQVANSVADKRESFLSQHSQDHLAPLSLAHRLTGLRVDYLQKGYVPPDVDPLLVLALGPERTGQLAGPEAVDPLYPQ